MELEKAIDDIEKDKDLVILGFEATGGIVSREQIEAAIDSLAETDFDEVARIVAGDLEISDAFT